MKPVFKWILGIVLGLIVIAAVIALVVFGHGWFGRAELVGRNIGPLARHPGMMGRVLILNASRFGWLGFISMGLIRLGGLILLIVGVVWLVNRLSRYPGTQPAATSVVASVAPAVPVAPGHTCSNCSKPVQDDWSICPYCGNKLSES